MCVWVCVWYLPASMGFVSFPLRRTVENGVDHSRVERKREKEREAREKNVLNEWGNKGGGNPPSLSLSLLRIGLASVCLDPPIFPLGFR